MALSSATLELLVNLKDNASSGLSSLTGALGTLGTAGLAVAAAGVAALAVGIKGGVDDALEARKLYASTEQTIKTMGNAAGRTADQVVDLASSLSDAAGMSLFGDDQIQASENLLLTFGNIKGETFDLATALTVDLAQALGGAPADQAMMLGKALNDPIKGITALGKAGLTFSEEQKKTIAALVKTGDMAGAQAIIIKELNSQVGGQAAAAAKAAGGWVQFKAGLGETFEMIGGKLLPVIDQLGAWLTSPEVQGAITAFAEGLANGIGVAASFIGDLVGAFQEAGPLSSEFGETLGSLASMFGLSNEAADTFQDVIFAVQAAITIAAEWISGTLIPALQALWAFLQANVIPILIEVAVWLRDNLPPAIAAAAAFVNDTLIPALAAVWAYLQANVIPILIEVATWLKDNLPPAMAAVSDFVTTTLIPAFQQVWAFIQDNIIPILIEVIAWLKENLPPAMAAVSDFITNTLVPAFETVWAFIQDNIIPIIALVGRWFRDNLPPAMRAASNFITNTLVPAFNAVWAFVKNNVIPILTSLADVAIALVKKQLELMSAVWTGVLQPALDTIWKFIDKNIVPVFKTLASFISDTLNKALGSMGTTLSPVAGWFSDIGDAVKDVIDFLSDLAGAINSIEIPDWLKGHSPPPMAKWLSAIASTAADAGAALEGVGAIGGVGASGAIGGVRGAGQGGAAVAGLTTVRIVIDAGELKKMIKATIDETLNASGALALNRMRAGN